MNGKRIIVVLGMHRSGTSAVAKALETMGVSLGNNLMGADEFNTKGYFEDIDIFRLNEQIMVSIGSDWDQLSPPDENKIKELCLTPYFGMAIELLAVKLKDTDVLGIKDPRLSILLPFWNTVFERSGVGLSYVIAFRNPLGVAESLLKRNQMPLVKSWWLWVIHVLKSLVYTAGAQRVITDYDGLLVNPQIQVENMAAALHLQVQSDRLEEYVTRFLDPGLNHYIRDFEKMGSTPDFPRVASEIYRALKLMAEGKMSVPEISELAARWEMEIESYRPLLALNNQSEVEVRKMTGIAVERHRLIDEYKSLLNAYKTIDGEKDHQISDLNRELETKTAGIKGLRELLAMREQSHEAISRDLSEQTTTIKLKETIQQKNSEISGLRVTLSSKEEIIGQQSTTIKRIRHSLSWRITAPLRRFSAGFPWWRSQVSRCLLSARIIWLHRGSGYFDADWYLSKYPDVKAAGRNPLIHFARHGMFEERSPNQEFDSQNYLWLNPDVGLFGRPPVVHFMLLGFREQRNWKNLNSAVPSRPTSLPAEYATWIDSNENREEVPGNTQEDGPLISILLPVYKVKGDILDKTFRSVMAQKYRNWELCTVYSDLLNADNLALVNQYADLDTRIRVEVKENEGISGNSNATLAMARGEFIGLLDHDDELSETALLEIAWAIVDTPEADFLYTDKDSITEDSFTRMNPLFKPEWSPETMYSVNYVTHFNVIRKSLVDQVEGFRSCTDGAQDWDLFLRVSEKARKIVRVPGIHYHWRIHEGSTSTGLASKPYALDAQLRTLRDSFHRRGIPALVEPDSDSGFRIRWEAAGISNVLVLIDGTGVNVDLLYNRITGVLKTAGQLPPDFYRLTVLVDRNSSSGICKRIRHHTGAEVIETTSVEKAGIINKILHSQHNSYPAIVFLSGMIDLASPGWLCELAGWVIRHPGIGFAGGIILDEKDQVVEAGLVTDEWFNGSPLFRGSPLRSWGWFGGPLWFRNISACNPWIVALNGEACRATGEFDEQTGWPKAFIMKCRIIGRNGMRGLITPHVRGIITEKEILPVPVFHSSMNGDPCFHPAFSSVVPLHLVSPAPGLMLAETPPVPLNPFAFEALVHASSCLCSTADLDEPQQHPERIGNGDGAAWCNWYIPYFENPAYGGTMTILRFAEILRRHRQIRHRFIVMGDPDTGLLQKKISALYPALADSEYMNLPSDKYISSVPPADFSFATLWTTAYSLLKVRNTGFKFYFIQDFEPLFYPAGSVYAQAELTYRFGFYGVVNTWPLKQVYEQEYHGTAIHFVPQVDTDVFYGDPLRKGNEQKRIFFYARPDHPRNGFELASEAMKILKKKLGPQIIIMSAGAQFDERRYGLEGVVKNLGVLDYEATADLYRTCEIGLVMMMTRHPSYLPFELMACGALLVSNHNPVNSWLLKNDENCLLVAPNPMTIAEKLIHAVGNFDHLTCIRKNGHDLVHSSYSNWEKSFTPVMEFIDNLRPGR